MKRGKETSNKAFRKAFGIKTETDVKEEEEIRKKLLVEKENVLDGKKI